MDDNAVVIQDIPSPAQNNNQWNAIMEKLRAADKELFNATLQVMEVKLRKAQIQLEAALFTLEASHKSKPWVESAMRTLEDTANSLNESQHR